MGLIKNFHKNLGGGGNMLPYMTTMIICVKHLFNIPDIFFLILALEIILNKFQFSQKFGGKHMLPWQP